MRKDSDIFSPRSILGGENLGSDALSNISFPVAAVGGSANRWIDDVVSKW